MEDQYPSALQMLDKPDLGTGHVLVRKPYQIKYQGTNKCITSNLLQSSEQSIKINLSTKKKEIDREE